MANCQNVCVINNAGLLIKSASGYRFVVLFFNCMLTFGSYFCFDMPSVLQPEFQGNYSCPDENHTEPLPVPSNISNVSNSCCRECLGMSPNDYNLLYAIYAWTNAIVVIGAGFLIDKLGNRVGAFMFSFLCVTGSSLFAAGAMFRGTAAMLPLMLIGRLIFGSGNGSLSIVQNRITAYWFRDKELALAFGVTLAFSRLGSVLNFLLTHNFEQAYGLSWTLWGGALLCGLGFVSAIIVSSLDKIGVRQLGDEGKIKTESKQLKFTDIRHFSIQYWLLALTIMFFYNGIFPFVADASKFIADKYRFGPDVSAYMAGAVYDVSMVLSPFLGGIIDIIGKRGILAIGCAVFSIPVFGLLAFTYVHPLVSTLWLGFMYSLAAASLWPSIPLVVTQATVGTAMGVTTSLQMIGIGISNLIVGEILGTSDKTISTKETLRRWKFVMIFLLANTLACVTTAVLLNVADKRKGGILNESRRAKKLRRALQADLGDESVSNVATYNESEPSETDPLLGDKRNSINT